MQNGTELDSFMSSVVLPILEDLNTPRSVAVYMMVKYREWDQVCNLRFVPSTILSWSSHDLVAVDRAKRDYQATDLLRKADFLPTSGDLEEKAIEGFIQSEQSCAKTNARLAFLHPCARAADQAAVDPSGAIKDFLSRVKKKLRHILGPVPPTYLVSPRYGPGSVLEAVDLDRSSRRDLTVLDKIDRLVPHVTPLSKGIFLAYYWESAVGRTLTVREGGEGFDDRGLRLDFETVVFNRFATVPKDSTKLRAIGIEPGGLLWLQLGYGGYLKQRLRRFGLLLENGESEKIHHEWARFASVHDDLATIDLSSASDTISKGLVELLLPRQWYNLLSKLRVGKTYVAAQKRVYHLEKFSSMGNGFTFELETAIFYAICSCIVDSDPSGDGRVSVYGDDILVPACWAKDVISALRFFGFTPNERKTFVSGHFRESCGGDFFNGVPIMPARLVEMPNKPSDWISLCNALHASWPVEQVGGVGRRSWLASLGMLPRNVQRCQCPSYFGDVGVHWERPRGRWNPAIQNYEWRFYVPVPAHKPIDRHDSGAQVAYALLKGSPDGPTPRKEAGIAGYRVQWSHGDTPFVETPKFQHSDLRARL